MPPTDQDHPPDSTLAPVSAPAPSSPGWINRIEVVALLMLIGCGLMAWGMGIPSKSYDYDEVTRAHSVWLASRGQRPYNDFFEVHPPYFRLLVPVVEGRANPLRALRVLTMVGNLLFLVGLGVLGGMMGGASRHWAWLGLALVAFQPDVLAYLVEFRIDGWGYALATWGLVRYGRRSGSAGVARDFEVGLTTGIATLWFCPKLTILPALVVGFRQLRPWVSFRRAVRGIAAYALGVGGAVGLFIAFLLAQGIDLNRMSQLLVRYHAISVANGGFRRGLLGAILDHRLLLGATLAGLIGWASTCARRRLGPDAAGLGLLVWLAAQATLVAYPYKQYYAPWFLFAASYLGFLGSAGALRWRLVRLVRLVLLLVTCGFTGFEVVQTARSWTKSADAQTQEQIMAWMDQVAQPDDRVVGSPPIHPINRFDTFFVWFNTHDASGFDASQILAQLPSFRSAVTEAQFAAELAAHPPAFVMLGDVSYPTGQEKALNRHLAQNGYQVVFVGPVRFAVRPDRIKSL